MLMPRLTLFPAALSTLRHVIDEHSPLHGGITSEKRWKAVTARFVASIVCVDTVIPAPSAEPVRLLVARRALRASVRRNLAGACHDGKWIVDYGKLHDTEPADAPRSLQ